MLMDIISIIGSYSKARNITISIGEAFYEMNSCNFKGNGLALSLFDDRN